MKQSSLIILFSAILCLTGTKGWAQFSNERVEIDGIYYMFSQTGTEATMCTDRNGRWYSGDIVIPEKVTYNGKTYTVTSIYDNAFYGNAGLLSVSIPESVTRIGGAAFYGCKSLTALHIPNAVTQIGYNAFSGCSSLTSINIPEGVTVINWGTFSGCSALTSLSLPEGITSIGSGAFQYCSSLTSINIPRAVTVIPEQAFEYCSSLPSITLPEGLTTIRRDAFGDCKGLTSITFPESLTSIGEQAFYWCTGLTSVTIPKGVTSIGNSAFNSCIKLTTVTIEGGGTSIGKRAFWAWRDLKDVFCLSTQIPELIEKGFGEETHMAQLTLHVPASAVESYKAADIWCWFGQIVPIEVAISSVRREPCTVDNYLLNGIKSPGLQRGMNILHMNDGTSRKVVVK